MTNHHIFGAGVSFEIQFILFIKIWAGEHIFLHMDGNYRLKTSLTFKSLIEHLFADFS